MRQPHMSNRKFRRVLIPAMVLLAALAFTVTAGMLSSADNLNSVFGKGRRTVVSVDGSDSLDTAYYPQLYANAAQSQEAAFAVSKQISDEGIVLLKNNGLLPLSPDTPVSPMGLGYCLPVYGSTGSGAIDINADYIVSPQQGLDMAFSQVNSTLDKRLMEAFQATPALEDNPNLVSARPLEGGDDFHVLYAFSPSVYEKASSTCRGTVGIVFLGRLTGEDLDASTSVYDDGTVHMLAPTAAELETIAFAKRHCQAVVVVLSSSTPMEVTVLEDDPDIDAILWMGAAGSSGYASLGDILTGVVVPSGRLPDTYPASFKADPTFANQDDGSDRFVYDNAYTTMVTHYTWQDEANTPFHEYEEGVYLGYRYYETAYDLGFLPNYYNRTDGVLYPFGYGLSYTSFTQEIVDFSDHGGQISLTVRITNTGGQYTGKDVVQVYLTSPYTDLDRLYLIEKPTVQLIAFEKTGDIAPGDAEEVTISFPKEDMASYCYTHNNGDGTYGSYVLEQGNYTISIRSNSHDVLDTVDTLVPRTVWYSGNNPRQSEVQAQRQARTRLSASNQFEQISRYMLDPELSGAVNLSRTDWIGTQPTAPTDADRTVSDTVVQWIAAADTTQYAYETDPLLGSAPGSLVYRQTMPASGTTGSLVLADLRGASYDNPMWDMLLDQLDYSDTEQLRHCLFESAYQTGPIDKIGKPHSIEHDGPQGLTMTDLSGRNWIDGTCGYPSAPVMAATWNKTLMYDLGYMVGQEALLAGINGWYAPGMNLHRSPFGGRAAEYYSEDPVLSGWLGAQVISGGGDAGIYCAAKHLVLVDTEAHRNPHTTVWLTEQALRELYLKPFEIAMKQAVKTIQYTNWSDGTLRAKTMRAGDFLMAGDSAIGPSWSASNYALLTEVVRGEWGFQGFIISDMHLNSTGPQADYLLRAGSDALMSASYGTEVYVTDTLTATGQHLLRKAVKNICYTLVNSNLMQGVAPGAVIQYTPAPWQIGLLAMNGAVIALIIGGICWMAIRARDERRHPENYRD